jgi:hypothetical protein
MKLRMPQTAPFRPIIIFTLPIVLLIFVLLYGIFAAQAQQFSDLAQAFLHGHLYFLKSIGGAGYDPVLYNGHQYWSEGAFPAVVLLPFVAIADVFHGFFYQGYLDWLLVLSTLYLIYKLARHFKYTVEDSLILMFGFGLGSAFVGVASASSGWPFAQVVSTLLLFGSMYEYFTRKRWWLLGILCACIFLTRGTAAPIILFFVLELWRGTTDIKTSRIRRFLLLALPLAIAIGLQGIYNFLRFHNPFNGGYEYQLLGQGPAESRALGVFSIRHIPANLFSLLFGVPTPVTISNNSWSLKFPFIRNNSYGMSIFVTSPYFLYLLGRKWSVFTRTTRHLLVAAACSCLAVLCFYGIGRNQFGYRYSLDFLPELFVVFMIVYKAEHKGLTRGMKFLVLAAGIFNHYILLSYLF